MLWHTNIPGKEIQLLQHLQDWGTLPVPSGTRLQEMRVAMGRSLSRGEHSSVKGQYVPVALETALGNLLLFFLLAEALNARF